MEAKNILAGYSPKTIDNYVVRKVKKTDFEDFNRIREEGWVVAHVDNSLAITEKDIRENFADKKKLKDQFLRSFAFTFSIGI